MLKVNHTISSISKNSGGTSTYMKLLVEALDGNINQSLLCMDHHQDNLIIESNCNLHLVKKGFLSSIYSKPLLGYLKTIKADMFHGNGLWQYPVHAMSVHARKTNTPYIISSHGMLEPWALEQGRLKKNLALKLFQHKDLKQAACIHATATSEAKQIRNLGYKNPIAVIPNGVNLHEFPNYNKMPNKTKKLLFLSRIHPKKGIELLIQAWAELDKTITQNWVVNIVGNGEDKYIQSLKAMIKHQGLEQHIHILKPVFGTDKIKTYQSADLFVLPTYSENFGIVIAEALACNVPVITTKGTPWEDLVTYNCGDWIDIGVAPLKQSLENYLAKPSEELQLMGENGRKLIEEKYSMDAVARDMLLLYKWLLNLDEKPKFVNQL